MRDWCAQHRGWQGTAAELAEQARGLLAGLGLAEAGVVPNERLVRNYMQLGILERPVRTGKEAYFGVRQVVEFVLARKLVAEGWPLAKIAEFNRTHDLDALLGLLPENRKRTEAERLVAKFRQASRGAVPPPPSIDPGPAAQAPSLFLSHSAEWTRRRTATREALRALGNASGEPEKSSLLKLALTPWCALLIDPDRLQGLSMENLDQLGEAIAQTLREELQSLRRTPP
jgi:hypothetical protein